VRVHLFIHRGGRPSANRKTNPATGIATSTMTLITPALEDMAGIIAGP
jgi:hypothetical protein